jgi:hypothetical protein
MVKNIEKKHISMKPKMQIGLISLTFVIVRSHKVVVDELCK